MKKVLFCMLIVMALTGLSCKTTQTQSGTDSGTGSGTGGSAGSPTVSGARIDGTVTQDRIDAAFNQIYNTYRSRLNMTGAQEYTVQRGDTLSEITRRFYGNLTGVGNAGRRNGFYFPIIMMATDDHGIVDPDLIEPGMRLLIPDLRRNLNNPEARNAIKSSLNDVAYIYNRKGRPAEVQGLRALANSL